MSTPTIDAPRRHRTAEQRSVLIEDFTWLISCGESTEQAAARLGVTIGYLDHVMRKHHAPNHLHGLVRDALNTSRRTRFAA